MEPTFTYTIKELSDQNALEKVCKLKDYDITSVQRYSKYIEITLTEEEMWEAGLR